ncbi:hypothetical protein OEB96_37795 [Paraliomyxa miuraensis]|nr:hypothetical protein [Paraliomyxa miuraensis]
MTAKISIIVGLLALSGCRNPGLPPEAPEHDATNPEAGVVKAKSPADPFASAFEGVKLDGGGHHHHHGHGKAEAEPEPAKTEPAEAEPANESSASVGRGQGGRS